MKLHQFSAVLLLGLCSVFSAFGQKQTTAKPSWFKQDKDGVLWFQKGEDEETKYSASLKLSAVTDSIVILVTANEKHIHDALGLAKIMQGKLEAEDYTPDHIPIVAWKDGLPGAAYTFYTDGLRYGLDSKNDEGVYQPSGAKKVLINVGKYYDILRKKYAASGKWGKHQEGWKALKIVKAGESQNVNHKK